MFLRFNDGTSGTVDLAEFRGKGVFRSWDQEGIFEQVSLTPAGALEWPGEIDLCPDSLYLRMTGKPVEDVLPALAVHA